ncbi:MAG: hypothetical protein ACJAZN_000282 [Planctomycetota bacterium]|jgi:hypothetical protein
MSIVVALLLIGATSAWGVQSFLDKQQAEGDAAQGSGMDSLWLRLEVRGVPAAIVGMLDRLMPEMERRAGIAHAMVQRTITHQAEVWELAAARLTQDPPLPRGRTLAPGGSDPAGARPGLWPRGVRG